MFSMFQSQLSRYISGVILHHETIYQKTSKDVEFVELLRQKNIVAGVKVDRGLVPLFGTEDEKTTQGLDDLWENCIRYKKEGCHFAKWRCVFSISERCPSQLAMNTNANVLARCLTTLIFILICTYRDWHKLVKFYGALCCAINFIKHVCHKIYIHISLFSYL